MLVVSIGLIILLGIVLVYLILNYPSHEIFITNTDGGG